MTAGAGGETGTCRPDVPGTATGCPHWLQKCIPAASGAPHAVQNFGGIVINIRRAGMDKKTRCLLLVDSFLITLCTDPCIFIVF
jgi:hypothetical protein